MQDLMRRLTLSENARRSAEDRIAQAEDRAARSNAARQQKEAEEYSKYQMLFTRGLPIISSQQLQATGSSITMPKERMASTEPVIIRQKKFSVCIPSVCSHSDQISMVWHEKEKFTKLTYSNESVIQTYVDHVLKDLAIILMQDLEVAQDFVRPYREQTIFSWRPDLTLVRDRDSRPLGYVEVKCPDREQGCPPTESLEQDPVLSENEPELEPEPEPKKGGSKKKNNKNKKQQPKQGAGAAAGAAAAAVATSTSKAGVRKSLRQKKEDNEEITVDIKDPLRNDIVARQCRDYLMYGRNEHGVRFSFCILTTWDYWRICWLPDEGEEPSDQEEEEEEEEKHRASASSRSKVVSSPSPSPASDMDQFAAANDMATLQRLVLQANTESGRKVFASIKTRQPLRDVTTGQVVLHASRVFRYDEPELTLILLTVLYKMWLSPFVPAQRLLQPERQYMSLSRGYGERIIWTRLATEVTHLQWLVMPPPQTKHFFILKRLGTGLHGTAFLACSASGSVCVIKFASDILIIDHRARLLVEESTKATAAAAASASSSRGGISSRIPSAQATARARTSALAAQHVFAQEAERWQTLWGNARIAHIDAATKSAAAAGAGAKKKADANERRTVLEVATNAACVRTEVISNRPCLIMPFVWTYRGVPTGMHAQTDPSSGKRRQTHRPTITMRASDLFFTPKHALPRESAQGVSAQSTSGQAAPPNLSDENEEEAEEGDEEDDQDVDDDDEANDQDQNASATVEIDDQVRAANQKRNQIRALDNCLGPGVTASSKEILMTWGHHSEQEARDHKHSGADLFEQQATREMIQKHYTTQAALACRTMLSKGLTHDDPKVHHVGLMPVAYTIQSESKQTPATYHLTFMPVLIDLTKMSKVLPQNNTSRVKTALATGLAIPKHLI